MKNMGRFLWQKARVVEETIEHLKGKDLFPHLVGKFVWVRCDRPGLKDGIPFKKEGRTRKKYVSSSYYFGLDIGLVGDNGNLCAGVPRRLELLPVFSFEDITPVPFDVWSRPDWKGLEEEAANEQQRKGATTW